MVKENEIYKPIAEKSAMQDILVDIEKELPKFKDPIVFAGLLHLLSEERENSNRMFKTIIERLDRIEKELSNESELKQELLPDVDQKIIDFIKQKEAVCANEVKKQFKYKGVNAASARLNRLCSKELLVKQQVGRKVYFKLK
ncbi:hypothetical protein KO317_02860 [Candidatus Micrarchaeota archaeon]|jgi:hypothetical protein|nr:hypothetical protein [Candidatus Micrarchaeota archaeon]